MISFIFKPLLWFSFSFLVLSIPVSERPLFDHISGVFGPTAQGVINDFGSRASESVQVGKKAIKQLFQTIPSNGDKVELRQSSSIKKVKAKEVSPKDEYTIEEKALLKQILNQ
tara:strand:+ start:295 stop:633 length:339 start_codon:yes stop_codon:yes gene_type:complete